VIRARMRAKGKRKATIQALISAELMLIMGAQPTICGMLSNSWRM
jgi:hypothetical protein